MIDRLKMLFGWDLLLSIVATAAFWILMPEQVPNSFARDMYGVGISVLSIVFSIFVAALAIIMSSSDDEFLKFLEAEGLYTLLLWGFKFTLLILFVALMYGLYTVTSYRLAKANSTQTKLWLVVFTFLSSWGLFATLSTTFASIKYANRRITFLTRQDPGGGHA